MANKHQRVLAQWNHFQLGIARRVGDQTQINNVAQHILIDLVGTAIFQMDVDSGIGLEEFLQVGRQVVQADAVNGSHANRARDDVLDLLQAVVQGIVSLNDLLAVFVKHLALAREAEFLLAAFDQQRFELRSSELICWLTADWVTLLI